jgi:hypothetical protein
MEKTITTDTTNREYSLSSLFFQMRTMWEQTMAHQIICIPREQFVDEVEILPTIPTRIPYFACVIGFDSDSTSPVNLWRVRFDSTPDAVYTIKYWFYWLPQDISGTIISPIARIGFEELLIWAATAAALYRNDPEGYQLAESHYQRLLPSYRTFNVQGPAQKSERMPRDFSGSGMRGPVFDPSHYNNG